MFPMEFEHQMLSSLPLPSEHGVKKVLHILQSLVAQRTVPYFRNRRGTDLMLLARLKQTLQFHRLEDDENRIRTVSLLTPTANGWNLQIHERVFDYMAFIIPLKHDFSIGEGNIEERKMLAFFEFLLRHQVEHILYPERSEQEVIRSDIEFAMDWKKEDPTAYIMLRNTLTDNMNGLRGTDYLDLLNHAEQGKPCDCIINRIVNSHVKCLVELPSVLIENVFPMLDTGVKTKVLGEYYRTTRSTSHSLIKRASSFQNILRLFSIMIKKNYEEAATVFKALKDKWGLVALFHEMELPESYLEEKNTRELLDLFQDRLKSVLKEREQPTAQPKPQPSPSHVHQAAPTTPAQQSKSIKERIEEARNDPSIPPQVMELIDKNKMNASGQSGAKYSELIEILLAIPWGRIRKIWVTPDEFETGLNNSHFGLKKPKEIISDFFSNLIWRYQHFREEDKRAWQRTGSALLFVGPPGVGKTSLAISIARSMGIPYHKISLGGMKDEADIRGYGFTYEGSKPGPIVQGLIKMGAMNGMFILDEADKTEKFAIATLLEILDPEQNHLYHDKYTQSTIDIDLSNSHFILTANTLDTVPSPILNRCEVIFLDRYSVEEKIAIARHHLIQRVRDRYMIGAEEIFFDPDEESELLRHLIRSHTFEAGVRDLERIIRTLFLRVHRKEILGSGKHFVRLTKERIREYLDEPNRPRHINEEDRIGEMMGLGVNMEMGLGSLIPIQVTPIKGGKDKTDGNRGYMSLVHATGNLEKIMDESRKVAATAIVHRASELEIDEKRTDQSVHLHFMGGSTKKDGPSAGGAIALALASLFKDRKVRRDVAMTGEIDTQGRITGIGGLDVKLETAYAAGIKTIIIPKENLTGNGGISRLPDALKKELQILSYDEWKRPHDPFDYTRHVLQVVAVDNIIQAADVAFIDEEEINSLESEFVSHAQRVADELSSGDTVPLRCVRLVHVSNAEELDPQLLQPGVCEVDFGSVLLVAPELRKTIENRLSGVVENVEIREFDPYREKYADVIEEVRDTLPSSASHPLRISVVAPLFFLKRDGIRPDDFPQEPGFEGLRIFASTCTIENVQIQDCRTVLNRSYHHLARLEPEALKDCPFLVHQDGIHMIRLSFIPEKYRLDTKRSEDILQRCVGQWLSLVEGERIDIEPAMPGFAMAK
jgi:endopeptidase La